MTALNIRVEVARKTREEGGDSVKRWLAHTMNLLILKVITAFPSLIQNFDLHLGDGSSNFLSIRYFTLVSVIFIEPGILEI